MKRRCVPIATVEVISKRYGATARREEASGDQRVVANERRCVRAMGEDVPIARPSVSSARKGVMTARSDASPARCE
jgi:hypothetical protein